MKLKSLLAIIITLTVIASCFCVPAGAAEVKTKKAEVMAYQSLNLTFKKSSAKTYTFKVKNNDAGYIKADVKDEGSYAWIMVYGRKKTADTKPTITVYNNENGTKTAVKKFSITVKPVEKIDFDDFLMNVDTTKTVSLKNPYEKDYKFEFSNKGIIEIDPAYNAADGIYNYTVKGKKKGSTTVTAKLKGTKKVIGTFTATVGEYAARVKPEFKNYKLKQNGHGSSTYMADSHFYLSDILDFVKAKAKYSVDIENDEVADFITENAPVSHGENKKTSFIYATGKGKTKVTVYEKAGSAKKKAVDTFTITVKKAKMDYVAVQNRDWYNDGVFGNGEWTIYLSPGEKMGMESTIISCLINNKQTGSHFKKKYYKITYNSSKTSVASISKDGVVTAKKTGSTKLTYTITFSDGTKFAETYPCQVLEEKDRPDI